MKEIKKIKKSDKHEKVKIKSAHQVFIEYFDLVDSYLGSIKYHLEDGTESHIALGKKIARYSLISDLLLDSIDDLGEKISQFWKENYIYVRKHLLRQKSLKCVYSGDLSPVDLEKFIKKSALYVDTVIIPDPLLNISYFTKDLIRDRKFYLNKLVRHVFNVWKMKDLILSKTKSNILIIYPLNIQLIEKERRDKLIDDGYKQYLKYCGDLFGKKFDSSVVLEEFFSQHPESESLLKVVKNKNILPAQYRGLTNFNSQFVENFNRSRKNFNILNENQSTSILFGKYVYSQFIRTEEHKFFCEKLSAEPIYDHEAAWSFLNYNLGSQGIDSAIINALQRKQFEWIGNVPLSAITSLREEGELEYFREILRKGVFDLKVKKDSDLEQVIKDMQKNFREAFDKQRSEVKQIQDKVKKITHKDIPITIAGTFLGFIPYGNLLSLPSTIYDLRSSYKSQKDEKENLKSEKTSAINLLMQSYENKKTPTK